MCCIQEVNSQLLFSRESKYPLTWISCISGQRAVFHLWFLEMRYTPFTRYNRLSNRLTDLTALLNEQPLFVQPVVKPRCTTGLTTGCIHDAAGCQTGCQTGLTTG